MGRQDRHPNKEIRKAIKRAEDAGWHIEKAKGGGHRWGTLACGGGCEVAIWGTPRRPASIAKRIGEAVDRCGHEAQAPKQER